jgi:hypothetical protein
MTMVIPKTAVGVFYDRAAAEKAVEELRRAGFGPDQLGVAVREAAPAPADKAPAGTHTEEGAVTGVVAGGTLGGLLGAVAVGVIPGIGPVLAASLLAGILGGVGAGATAGGLLGALIGHGIPEDEARQYEQDLAAGRTIVTVKSQERHDEAVAILLRHGARGKGSPLV